MGKMKRRGREAVIRFHRFRGDTEAHFHSKLMLYTPWRDEEVDLIGECQTYEESFQAQVNLIAVNEAKYTQNAEVLQQAENDLHENGPPDHAWPALAPGAEEAQANDKRAGADVLTNLDEEDRQNAPHFPEEEGNAIEARYTTEASKALMDHGEYCKQMEGVNEKQRTFLMNHRGWCKSAIADLQEGRQIKPYYAFLSGAGGVGKSHVIKLLHHDTMRLFRNAGFLQPGDVGVLLSAPTGTAAFNIDGLTVHAALLLTPCAKKGYQRLGHDRLNTFRSKCEKLLVLVIDEISMVGVDLLYSIHRRLQELKNVPEGNGIFGNVSVVCVGDLYQLAPVKQPFVFKAPSDHYARLCSPLWHAFKFAELTQIMRQRDTVFVELLNRVRTATCSVSDLDMLAERNTTPNAEGYPCQAIHVFTTNDAVNKHNAAMLEKLESAVFTIVAEDGTRDADTHLVDVNPSLKYTETGGLWKVLQIGEGARVMLTVNLSVTDGLVNGAQGKVVMVVHRFETVFAILVEFDDARVGGKAKAESEFKGMWPNAVPIERYEARYTIGRYQNVSNKRKQCMLTLRWCSSFHKVPAMTMTKIVVCVKGTSHPG